MRILFAGLWARRGINAAAMLVILIAVTAAVLAPMYGRASAEHLVDSRLAARAPYTTGLAFSVPAMEEPPVGDPARFTPPDPRQLVDQASAAVAGEDRDRFWPRETSWLLDRGGSLRYGESSFTAPLYWRDGMCDLAVVEGRCPSAAGEVLVQRTMARTLGVAAGDRVELTFTDQFLRREDGRESLREDQQTRTVEYAVVGTYRVENPDSPAWFDLSRFTGIEDLNPPPGRGAGSQAVAPAMLATPESMASQTFRGGVDRPVDPGAVDLDGLDQVEAAGLGFQDELLESSTGGEVEQLELSTLFDEVRDERGLLQRVMVAALAPLLVLSLLLLFALVSAGASLRRPYVALAKLRGHTRRQVFGFAVGEPFLVVLLAAPLGLAAAVLLARVIAGIWLTPGIPVAVDPLAWAALATVVVSALVASAVAALDVIREPLSRALAASIAVRGPSRAGRVLRSAVVAVAAAAVLQLLTSDARSSDLLALLAPMLIALAVAIGGAWLLRVASVRWLGRTTFGRGTPAYLASRRLARRSDLANLMMPLLLAVSVITFAVSASAVSRARADVGAAGTFQTEVTVGRLLAVTREVDPEGRYLAAAAVDNGGDDMSRRVFVDSTRLAGVAAWDDSWADVPVETIQRALRPPADRITFTGRQVAVTVVGVDLASSTQTTPVLGLQYVNDAGEQRNAELGVLRNGSAPRTLTADVSDCESACTVEQLFVGGDNLSVLDANGTITLTDVSVDGRSVDWRLGEQGAWRPARPFPVSLVDPPVDLVADGDALTMEVYLGQLPSGAEEATMVAGIARITPAGTPDVVPAVVADATATSTARQSGAGTAIEYDAAIVRGEGVNGAEVPMQVVARAHALPGLGDEGALADLETSLVEFEPPFGATVLPQLWAAADTPASVLDEVRAAGVPLTPLGDLDEVLDDLRADAFSLGLRLFLLVGLATLLLAVFGVFASAVLQSRWRSYEVASLRVVGISQGTLLRASVLEYVAMLGLAVVLGLGAAYLSLRLVLPSLSLGPAAEHEPTPLYATHGLVLLGVGVMLFVVATSIALLVSRRIVRLGRPAILRWAEQG